MCDAYLYYDGIIATDVLTIIEANIYKAKAISLWSSTLPLRKKRIPFELRIPISAHQLAFIFFRIWFKARRVQVLD